MSGTTRPKKVLLFGKTGDGKSTVANMLLTGGVGSGEAPFTAGNSLGAVTKETKEFTNAESNWTIIDTVGMFPTDRPTEDQRQAIELHNYLAKQHQYIDLFLYIKKASKFTGADEMCWKAFNTLLHGTVAANLPHNVLLVFTSCSEGEEWVKENESIIIQHMSGRGGTLFEKVAVDFPPHNNHPEVEKQLKGVRDASLKHLKAAVERKGAQWGPVRLIELPPDDKPPGLQLDQGSLENVGEKVANFFHKCTHGSPTT